ncbi:GL15981 [Drosophila persimilis]|uniref:GL15981 n=1 Tax=Drosophila persimilis TaxID=7234 RepID=B4H9Y5_DROPE|nr:GL15981 [Drosophila persimilis]
MSRRKPMRIQLPNDGCTLQLDESPTMLRRPTEDAQGGRRNRRLYSEQEQEEQQEKQEQQE